jgi:ubiquinone/menaquinone biosynthesis C-methylase UbiE
MGGYYDEIAPGYQELHGEEQRNKALLVLKNIEVNPSDLLLDVGCGTAKYLSLFSCKKMGIDPASELLKQADVPVVQGVAEKLPFSANSFDIVLSLTAIHNFDDSKLALNEMLRVARRDIVISVLRRSLKFTEIEKAINEILPVSKRIDETFDVIFFCRKTFK